MRGQNKDRIASLSQQTGVKTLLAPVNFGNQGWCGMIVCRSSKRITYYDSMNSGMYARALDKMA